jgi:bacterioferritin-associated ferredoxin
MSDRTVPPEETPAPTFVCRCDEISIEEVAAALAAGAQTVNDVKWRTRAGMGVCQGIYCVPVIAALVSQATGVPVDRVAPITTRPPVRPLPLEALASLELDDESQTGNVETPRNEERA